MQPDVIRYDDFAGPELNPDRWTYLEYPMPEGPPWRCQEPGAKQRISDGTLTVEVDRFEQAHDQVQIIDNPKHLLLSTQAFAVPETGVTTFSVDMAASNINGDPHDYRDGVAAFNVLDLANGWVFDVAASSNHVYAIYEMLPVPGAAAEPFTYMVNQPFAPIPVGAGKTHVCNVVLDAERSFVTWTVDGARVFQASGVAVPREVRIGLGMFTLHPIQDGSSTSLRGQGMAASWSNLSVAISPS